MTTEEEKNLFNKEFLESMFEDWCRHAEISMDKNSFRLLDRITSHRARLVNNCVGRIFSVEYELWFSMNKLSAVVHDRVIAIHRNS